MQNGRKARIKRRGDMEVGKERRNQIGKRKDGEERIPLVPTRLL